MQTRFQANILVLVLLGSAAITGGGLYLSGSGTELDPNRTSARWSGSDYINNTAPSLTPGFKDWELCDLGGRIETTPPLFSMPHWGPAALTSASGCSTCGGGVTFSGNPKQAGLGLALSPPNDFSSDAGQLPPSPHDHAYVMADTGEVVYTEIDFVIPGQGFDFVWSRTYRSALEFEGWQGYGWAHSAELYLAEGGNGKVSASLGNGRVKDVYTVSGGVYTSPDGFWDQLTKGTRGSGHTPSKYADKAFFTKTEKNGVKWEFDFAVAAGKTLYVCTSIEDTFGNSFTLEYDDTDVVRLTKVADVEGHEATFTYDGSNSLITKVTVSNTEIDVAYGDIVIDYTYNADGTLKKVEKQKTRKEDAGTVVRPYTEYSYYTSGNRDNDLQKIYYSSTTDVSYDFVYTDAVQDRCTQVTDADGEVHKYTFDVVDGSERLTKYIDPSNQRRDFVYTDYAGGDRTIDQVWEYLEDETGADLSGHYDLKITRACDCGQITKLEYPDGSTEEWAYDSVIGSVTKYTRGPKTGSAETDLVKQWTYATFANYSRMLTSSGWLRAEANPSSKVTWAWDADGGLNTVTWPTVTTGVPSSQVIVYDYEIGADGILDWLEDPEDKRTDYSYSGLILTTTKGSGSSNTLVTKETRDEMGNVTSSEGKFGSSSAWTYTVTPDGRVLKATGPDSKASEWEYDLRGRQIKDKLKVDGAIWVTNTDTLSVGGVRTQLKADDGGLNLITTFSVVGDEAYRYSENLDSDDFGSRSKWGYGSYGLPWETFNVDDSGASKATTLTLTLERDTMGRVITRKLMGGTEIDYIYDDFGRQTETHQDIAHSKIRKTIRTLKDWGGLEKVEVKEGATLHASTMNYYDQANRRYKTLSEDPEDVLADRTVELERDKNGRVTIETDARGEEWETRWFADGRVDRLIGPIGNEVRYEYNDITRTTTMTSHEKNTLDSSFTDFKTVTTYSSSGATLSVKEEGSASGNQTTSFTYFEGGKVKSESSPSGVKITNSYDKLGRVKSVIEEIDAVTTAVTNYSYTSTGKPKTITDANFSETAFVYNSLGGLLTTEYTVEVSPTKLSTITMTYDGKGRLLTEEDEMGTVKTYAYDPEGLIERVDIDKASSGLTGPDRLEFDYDVMGRMTSAKTQSYSGGSYSDLTTVTRAYDGYGQMKSETQHGSRTMTYLYDGAGTVKEIGFPSGGPIVGVKYTLDGLGRVSGVDRKLSTVVEGISTSVWEASASFKYEGHREIKRTQTKYDLDRTQSWTSFRRPNALRYEKDSSNALLTGFANTWNADSYITTRQRTHDNDGTYDWGEVYRYDEMGRLTKMWLNTRNPANFSTTDPTGSDHYDDLVEWNLGKVYEREDVKTTPKVGSSVTADYTNNEGYQYTNIESVPVNLTWDDNGQLTDWGTTDYAWTALGQLAQADVIGETARDYTYDAFGRRVSTKISSAETQFLYHGWHMIGEYDQTNSKWLWQEVPMNRGEGMLEHIALDTNDVDTDSNTTEYRQYAVHEDWQNSVWSLSDTSGAIVERYEQDDPFGASHTLDNSDTNIGNFASNVYHLKRMHGGVTEKVSGLYDFRNRWYSPISGGWLSRDPLEYFDSENLYQGILSGPLHLTDTFGNSTDYPCPGKCPNFDAALVACSEMSSEDPCWAECEALYAEIDSEAFPSCDWYANKLQYDFDRSLPNFPARRRSTFSCSGSLNTKVDSDVQQQRSACFAHTKKYSGGRLPGNTSWNHKGWLGAQKKLCALGNSVVSCVNQSNSSGASSEVISEANSVSETNMVQFNDN